MTPTRGSRGKFGTLFMLSGLLALVFASAFAGAALYLVLVEQPARLALDDASMIARMGAERPARLRFARRPRGACGPVGPRRLQPGSDIRFLIGALLVLASWPYTYFVIVPLNNRLLASGRRAARRRRARDRDLLGPARMGPVRARRRLGRGVRLDAGLKSGRPPEKLTLSSPAGSKLRRRGKSPDACHGSQPDRRAARMDGAPRSPARPRRNPPENFGLRRLPHRPACRRRRIAATRASRSFPAMKSSAGSIGSARASAASRSASASACPGSATPARPAAPASAATKISATIPISPALPATAATPTMTIADARFAFPLGEAGEDVGARAACSAPG